LPSGKVAIAAAPAAFACSGGIATPAGQGGSIGEGLGDYLLETPCQGIRAFCQRAGGLGEDKPGAAFARAAFQHVA